MIEQVLTLQPDDNVITLGDTVRRVRADRLIVVIPPDSELFRRRVDLQVVVRQARRRKLDLALVTSDPDVHDHARELGVPVFGAVNAAQGRRWRWPWQNLPAGPIDPRRIKSRRRQFAIEGDLSEMRRRRVRRQRFRWVYRVLGALFFLAALSVVGSLVYLAVPGARITLVPASEEVAVVVPIVAVPGLTQVDFAGRQVPARSVRVTVEGDASITTTGVRDVPDQPASGTVLFTNLLPQDVPVPAGTGVRTTAGIPIRFVTNDAVVVPASGQATVNVHAVEPGPSGNVDEGQINLVEGIQGLALRVINLRPTDGGSSLQLPAVTQYDRDTLKQILFKELDRQATVDMSASAGATEFVAADSTRVLLIEEENYDRFVGEQAAILNMNMRVVIEGVIVDEQAARSLVYNALSAKGGRGFELIPSSLRFRRGEITSVDGRGAVTFFMQGWAARTALLNVGGLQQAVAGKTLPEARAYLNDHLALAQPPEIAVWPQGFERLPYLAFRMQTDVVTATR
jgi:hypothetical protein